jgi:hypothetical protein
MIQEQAWQWAYSLPPPKTPEALVQTVQSIVDDLAFTHVGRWRPFEVTIYMPPLMANHADMKRAQQKLASWMAHRKCEWAFQVGGTMYRVKIRGERVRS